MTPEEVRVMIEEASTQGMKALIAFLYLYGTRISEALKLEKKDFTILVKTLRVSIEVEKKKQATAPIAWKHPLEIKTTDGNAFFVGILRDHLGMVSEGKIWKVSRWTAARKIKKLNAQCSPHIFRHTRNRRLAEKGADAIVLMDWNGWADTRPASNYLGLSGKSAKRFSGKID